MRVEYRLFNIGGCMAERRPRGTQAEETVVVEKEKKDFDPRTLGAFVSL